VLYYVRFQGVDWHDGVFTSNACSAPEACSQFYKVATKEEPVGKMITCALVASVVNGAFKGWLYRLVGDGSSPEGWELVDNSKHREE
jgi:hypothetical protein